MKYESSKHEVCKQLGLFVNGVRDACAYAFDTKKGYYERFVKDPKRPKHVKLAIVNGKRELAKERIYGPFVVKYKLTGAIFAQSK